LVKVLAIVGSPRRENTYRLIETVMGTINRGRKDVTAELIRLSDLKINHCNGCEDYCEKTGECKIQDDMQKLYPKLRETDVLIIGTPTYFWNVSGLIKDFIDRSLPLYYTKALKDKLGASVSVAGADGHNQALAGVSSFLQLQGMKEAGSVAVVRGEEPVGKAELKMAKVLGDRIVSQLS